MHTSYVSLAVFAMGAAAMPNMPKGDGNPFEGSFPFMPSGSSSVEDDDGMSNPVPAYMAAMQAVEAAQADSYNTPASNQQEVPSAMPFHPQAPVAQAVPEPVAQAVKEAPQPVSQPEIAQPDQPKPVTPKPASDDNQEFDAPMSQPSAPVLNNPIADIPEYAVPSSMASVIAHVKPSPAFSAVYQYSSSMSIMVSVPASSSMAPFVSEATAVPQSMPVEMAPVTIQPMPVQSVVQTPIVKPSSFITRPIVKAPAPTSITVPKPAVQSANIHEQHLASMAVSSSAMHATPSSSATPSPTAHAADNSISDFTKIPILGGLLASLTGLF